MARETKAERLAREQAAQAAYQASLEAEYPERVMVALELATKHHFDIAVVSGMFVVTERDSREQHSFRLTYNELSERALSSLECVLVHEEERERERQRKFLLKQSALAKLSAEERAALGL